ncbi:MAG: segregation/condensation protein A [Pseudomonadales bacterium]|nr:segregation/condensation protein A [Pseudomonadales bacterium]
MPFAIVYGEAVTAVPQDLYIPPDALEVFLEAFEGPLDLLLYLIKRQNLDILDVQVSEITKQYVEYVELMRAANFDLAAEYLVMAALLGEIKSRSLLPRPKHDEGEESDPRAELIRRLQEYERYKQAAEDIEIIPRIGRDLFLGTAQAPSVQAEKPLPDVDLREVLLALQEVLLRADMFEHHKIARETLSTRERMSQVLDQIRHRRFVPFGALFTVEEGRLGVVVTFLAILELVKESLIELIQTEAYAPIHVRAREDALSESESAVAMEEELSGIVEDDDTYELSELQQEEVRAQKELEDLSIPDDFSILSERDDAANTEEDEVAVELLENRNKDAFKP